MRAGEERGDIDLNVARSLAPVPHYKQGTRARGADQQLEAAGKSAACRNEPPADTGAIRASARGPLRLERWRRKNLLRRTRGACPPRGGEDARDAKGAALQMTCSFRCCQNCLDVLSRTWVGKLAAPESDGGS
ncbi:unnamed protein product [Lampetra planeri]